MEKSPNESISRGLRSWFIVHALADVTFALALFIAPRKLLELVGWVSVDPFATRLVAAALFGIGIESFLARNAAVSTYREMLNLKIIWSSCAIAGMIISIVEGAPAFAWVFVAIFAIFSAAWWYYRIGVVRQSG